MTEFQNRQVVRIVGPPALLRTSDPGATVYFGRVLKMRQIDGDTLNTVGGPVRWRRGTAMEQRVQDARARGGGTSHLRAAWRDYIPKRPTEKAPRYTGARRWSVSAPAAGVAVLMCYGGKRTDKPRPGLPVPKREMPPGH
jgi:hypothetical protein